ncbi:unnamed protein product [Schistosoma haematobium]|nr:unnamed protein product [Schistosoma haematobium]
MKCTFSFILSITLSLIIVLLHEFFECQDIYEENVPLEEEFVIHENRSHRYSFRFGYLQKISLNQPHPVVNGSFHKFTGTQRFAPKFSFKYFDTEVKRFDFYSTGLVTVIKEKYFGLIVGHQTRDYNSEYEVLNGKELLAAKWSVKSEKEDGTQVTSNITYLIYPNGKISFYYDNVLRKYGEINWLSKIAYVNKSINAYCPKYNSSEACNNASTLTTTCIWCERNNTCMVITDKDAHSLKVNDCHVEVSTFKPAENLMETTERTDQYSIPTKIDRSNWKADVAHVDERKGAYCPKYNSSEACNNASTLTTTCIWCERNNTCMVITDKDAHSLKVNDCHVEVSTFKPAGNLMETTERTDQYSYMTIETTEDNTQNETPQCLYFVIIVVVTFFVLCIVCFLGRYLYKRRKSVNGSQ